MAHPVLMYALIFKHSFIKTHLFCEYFVINFQIKPIVAYAATAIKYLAH